MAKTPDTFRRIADRQRAKYDERYEKYGDSHLALGWPDEKKNHKRFEVMMSAIRWGGHTYKSDGMTKLAHPTVLDFGCGLGHLYNWIDMTWLSGASPISYVGLDTNPRFVRACRATYSRVPFVNLDVLNDRDYAGLPPFDYIVCNGVFTEKLDTPWMDQWNYFMVIIERLWKRTQSGLAFNVATADCARDDLFDVPFSWMSDFIIHELGVRNFTFRHDYNPWEYTTYVYR